MDLTPLLTLLRQVDVFENRVAIATTLSTAVDACKAYKTTPVAVLHGLKEDAGPNARVNCPPLQPVSVTLSLLIVHRNVSDPYGAAASHGLDAARHAALQALLGSDPAPTDPPSQRSGHKPLEYRGGQLALAAAGYLAWLDQFTTEYFLVKEVTP